MRFTTTSGWTYTVDRVHNLLTCEGLTPLPFKYVTNLYAGSPGATFHDEGGDIIRHIPGIVSVDGPNERVDAEQGNLLLRTQNSTYEFDQEQLLVRRLAGINPATNPKYPDGDWRPYLRIENLAVDHSPFIVYGGDAIGKVKQLSRVREIIGTYIEPPTV